MTLTVGPNLGLLVDGAQGEDLDRWGQDRYRLPRKQAAPNPHKTQ